MLSGYFMTTLLKILFLLLILQSCDKRYKVNIDNISGSEAIKNGFHLSEITVNTFEKDGSPSDYSITSKFFCGPIKYFSGYYADSVYNETEKNLIAEARIAVDSIFKMNGDQIGGEGHNKGFYHYVRSQKLIDSLENLHFPFVAKKTIDFNKKSNNYKWIKCITQGDFEYAFDYTQGVFDTLPVQPKENQWYFINFSNSSNTIDEVFFKIDDRGKIHQYSYYKIKWGV